MRPMRYVVAAAVLGLMGHGALAFEETTVGAGRSGAKAAPVLELPKDLPKSTEDPAKGLNITSPEFPLTTPGTEVRIPGLGKVGVLPKLDFGLELLYGANEQKGTFEDKTNHDDVQLRGTIKHRF
jgi:hypothetical protein